jgi:hypothetical protein
MTQPDSPVRRAARPLAFAGWALVGLVLLHVATSIGRNSPADGASMVAALAVALPTLTLVGALVEFVRFFERVDDDEVFTERNARTLRAGGQGLVLAAFMSVVVGPSLAAWVGPDGFRGFVWHVNDLAIGVGAMGFGMVGIAVVFREAVRIKLDNDAIV